MNIHFKVTDGDGAVVKEFNKFVPKGAGNYSVDAFSLKVYGVGKHTYTLTASISGEVEKSTATVEVEPTSNVIANMTCKPAVVALGSSTQCIVHFKLKSAETVKLNLKEVDFGGKRVWPNGPSSVRVSGQVVTLSPTNMREDLTIGIDINGELANYYFGERPWDPIDRYVFHATYKSRFAGYSYLVRADFSGGITVSDVFSVRKQSEFINAAETAKNSKAIISETVRVYKAGKEFLTVAGKYGKIASGEVFILNLVFLITDLHDSLFAPTPNTGDDGNNVVGG